MPTAYDSLEFQFRHVRRFASRVSAAFDILHSHRARRTTAGPRVAATATLLGVIIVVVAMFAFPLQIAVIANPVTNAGIPKADDARASIKFIGAAPRSESCVDQVWPYIERRCLRRAADDPSIAGPGSSSRKGSENSKQRGTAE
jgi:hypothetical protein